MNFDFLQPIIDSAPYPLLFASLSGAHLYGFPSPDSDYDLRGAHILPLEHMIGLNEPQDTIEISEDTAEFELDLVTYDIYKYFQLLLTRNGNILDQVFSPLIVHTTPEHEELKALAQHCITPFHAHHYLGLARRKWEMFTKDNDHSVKSLLYVFRSLLSGLYLMQTGQIESNLVHLNEIFNLPYIPALIAQKMEDAEHAQLNTPDLELFKTEYARLVQTLETARDESHLPHEPQVKSQLNDLLLRIRLHQSS